MLDMHQTILPIDKKEQKEVEHKLKAGVSQERILEDARAAAGEKLERI